MFPKIRSVGLLLPLRALHQSPNREKNLLDHHRIHHPNEEYLRPLTHMDIFGRSQTGYDFFGRFVEFGTGHAPYMRISEVAARALEQTFGRADTLQEIFSVPWAMSEDRNPGSVFWDTTYDRIVAKTGEGFWLTLKGTNVVEAAVYLHRIYEEILKITESTRIPEGIEIIETQIEGPEEVWSMAASPLQIKCRVRNLDYSSDPFTLTASVRITLEEALKNRISD